MSWPRSAISRLGWHPEIKLINTYLGLSGIKTADRTGVREGITGKTGSKRNILVNRGKVNRKGHSKEYKKLTPTLDEEQINPCSRHMDRRCPRGDPITEIRTGVLS